MYGMCDTRHRSETGERTGCRNDVYYRGTGCELCPGATRVVRPADSFSSSLYDSGSRSCDYRRPCRPDHGVASGSDRSAGHDIASRGLCARHYVASHSTRADRHGVASGSIRSNRHCVASSGLRFAGHGC